MTELSASALKALGAAHYLHPFTDSKTIAAKGGARIISKADGVYVYTKEGQKLLDGMAGLWCVHIGYNRPEMSEAIAHQIEQLPYYNSFFGNAPDVTIELSARLAQVAPKNVNTFFFTNSGSESNDTIYKLARHYWTAKGKPSKKLFITRHHAYHGVSGVSTSLSGLAMMHPQWGYPLDSINTHVLGPYKFLHGQDMDDVAFGSMCAQAVEKRILELGADNIAAFMAEPVYGAGGVIPPPENYWAEVQEICRKHDILVCADEVITGFGRVGEWFASQHYDIDPDFLTLAKGLTSGYIPMGAVGLGDKVAETIQQDGGYLTHGFTYSGHPVAAVAALKNIDIIKSEKLVERVRDDIGPYLQERFATLSDHPIVGETRGVGSMAALEIVRDKTTNNPFPADLRIAYIAQNVAAEHGLIARAMNECLFCAPPLTISRNEIDFIVEALSATLDEVQELARKYM